MDGINIFFGIIGFGTLSYSAKQQYNINSADKKLKQFIKTKIFSPKDLISGIKEKEAYLVNQFKECGKNEISGKVFVEGLPYSELPLIGKINKQKLLHSIYFKEDIFSNDRIRASKTEREGMKYKVPSDAKPETVHSFQLRDYDGKNQCSILNNNNEEPNYDAALELISSKDELRDLNFVEKFLVFVCMLWDYMSFLQGGSGLRGIKIGVREKELGIKIENFLTVYGEVIYNFEKQTLRIESPEYFLKNKTTLLEFLKDYISSCKTARFISGLVGVICLGIVGYRIYQKNKRAAVGAH